MIKVGESVRICHGNHKRNGEVGKVIRTGFKRKGRRTWTALLLEMKDGTQATVNARRAMQIGEKAA